MLASFPAMFLSIAEDALDMARHVAGVDQRAVAFETTVIITRYELD